MEMRDSMQDVLCKYVYIMFMYYCHASGPLIIDHWVIKYISSFHWWVWLRNVI